MTTLKQLEEKWRALSNRQWQDGDNGQSIQSEECADELAAFRKECLAALEEAPSGTLAQDRGMVPVGFVLHLLGEDDDAS